MKLTRLQLLALLLGASLLIAGVAKAEDDVEEDEYDDGPDDDVDDELEEEGEVTDENVVVLTGDNFDSMISSHKYALDLAPHYAQAATALKAYNAEILIAKVDATEEETLAEQHDVQGFPTLKWFVDGESVDYDGGRTAETIIKWVKKKTGPPADTVDDVAALEQLERESEAVVVGYFTEFKGSEFDVFLEAASQLGDATFGQTTSAAVAEKAGLTKAPGLSVVTNFKTEEKRGTTVMEGAWEVQQLLKFVKGESVPLVIPFSQDTQDMIFSSGIEKHIMLMGPADTLAADSEAIKAATAAAKALKGSAVFVTTVLGEEEGEGGDLAEFFGVDEEQAEPVVVGFDMTSHMKFHMKEKLAADTLLVFAKTVVDGTAEPFFKSDPLPEEPLDGGVTVVVGKSFDEIVKDPKKDVLLEVYAPWCGHCKSLAPIYRKLAKRFAPIDSVVVAKMDGTRNEHLEAMPEGFPLIKFFPAEEGAAPVEFDGERTLLDLTKFIKQHARIPYELAKKKPASDEADAASEKAKDEL